MRSAGMWPNPLGPQPKLRRSLHPVTTRNEQLSRRRSSSFAEDAKDGLQVLPRNSFRDRRRYFLQLSLTMLMLVTLRCPCSAASLSMSCSFISSFTFSFPSYLSPSPPFPLTF